jgi:hypothetical protein
MTRRCFMGAASAGLAGVTLLPTRRASAAADLGEYIDIGQLRPRPDVRIAGAVVREKPPYWLGWPGTSYDVEGMREKFAREFDSSAQRVGVRLEQKAEPLEDDAAVAAFAENLVKDRPDAVILTLQHLNSWGKADKISQTGIPTIIFAPIGTAFTGHVIEISRRPGVHVVSSLEMSGIDQAFRMIRAKKQFEASRLMVVAGTERKESSVERLGSQVKYIPRDSLHELFNQIPETEEVRDVAADLFRNAQKVVEPASQDGVNAARSYVTAKRLLRDEGCNALTTDCLGMVTSKVVPTPPCMAATIFQDNGITYGCEADVMAAFSLMVPSFLLDKPGFMNDPVPETVKNVLITAHCTCGTKLQGFSAPPEPYVLRSHSESAIGVSTQVLWKEGQPVTLVRFKDPNEMIVDTGTVRSNVETPPAGGCRTNFEIDMDNIEDVRDVAGFHQVVFYGDHRRDVEAFCQMYGIKAVHSPEHPPAEG